MQGPFVSLSEAFAKGELVQKLADHGTLHHAMPGLIGYLSMWKHQQQVFEAVKKCILPDDVIKCLQQAKDRAPIRKQCLTDPKAAEKAEPIKT